MPRRPVIVPRPAGLSAVLVVLLLAIPAISVQTGGAKAQPVGGLLLPRGSVLIEVEGRFEQVSEQSGVEGRVSLGEPFGTLLTAAHFPALASEEEALRALLGDSDAQLRAGRVDAFTEINTQRVPVRLGYGVLSRVSVGVTAPMVRRRTDASLLVSGAGANVGQNPNSGAGREAVQVFQAEAQAALTTAQTEVEAVCSASGASSPSCLAGLQDLERAQGILSALANAWSSAVYFPLQGSGLGGTLQARWAEALGGLARWGAEGPSGVPLATSIDTRGLEQRLIDPLGEAEAFPRGVPDALYALGDAEIHFVLGLTGPSEARLSSTVVQSAVELSLRLATGTLDSMAVLLPQEPLGGHAGFGVRWVSDLQPSQRLGVGIELGWQTFQQGEGRLLAVSPDFFWEGMGSGVEGRLTPGDRQWVQVAPRAILLPGLSIGVGYRWWNRGDDTWAVDLVATDPVQPVPSGTLPGGTLHEMSGELAFAGWRDPVLAGLPFPVELRFRGSRVVSGDPGMPVYSVLQMQGRILRRR